MPNINFNDLPCDIKSLIFNINKQKDKEEKQIEAFWKESENYYDVELEEWFEDGQINAPIWDELTSENKKKVYEYHLSIQPPTDSDDE